MNETLFLNLPLHLEHSMLNVRPADVAIFFPRNYLRTRQLL